MHLFVSVSLFWGNPRDQGIDAFRVSNAEYRNDPCVDNCRERQKEINRLIVLNIDKKGFKSQACYSLIY